MSLVVLGLQGGEASIPLAFAALTIGFGYRVGWSAAALVLLVVGLPLAYWCYRRPRVPHGQLSTETTEASVARSWTRREVLRDPVFWALLTGVLAPAFIGTTIFYHQNYLTTLNDWPLTLFAQSLVVMALTTVVCALLTGAAIDRYSAVQVLPSFLLPLAAACLVLANSGPAAALYVAMILLGISYGIASTLFGALWPEIYGLENLGAIRAVTVSAAVLATAAGPGITGTLIDHGVDLPAQFKALAFYCLAVVVVMTVAAAMLRRRR